MKPRQTWYGVFGAIAFWASLGIIRGQVKGPATFALHYGCVAVAVIGTVVLIILDVLDSRRPKKGRKRRDRRRDLG